MFYLNKVPKDPKKLSKLIVCPPNRRKVSIYADSNLSEPFFVYIKPTMPWISALLALITNGLIAVPSSKLSNNDIILTYNESYYTQQKLQEKSFRKSAAENLIKVNAACSELKAKDVIINLIGGATVLAAVQTALISLTEKTFQRNPEDSYKTIALLSVFVLLLVFLATIGRIKLINYAAFKRTEQLLLQKGIITQNPNDQLILESFSSDDVKKIIQQAYKILTTGSLSKLKKFILNIITHSNAPKVMVKDYVSILNKFEEK